MNDSIQNNSEKILKNLSLISGFPENSFRIMNGTANTATFKKNHLGDNTFVRVRRKHDFTEDILLNGFIISRDELYKLNVFSDNHLLKESNMVLSLLSAGKKIVKSTIVANMNLYFDLEYHNTVQHPKFIISFQFFSDMLIISNVDDYSRSLFSKKHVNVKKVISNEFDEIKKAVDDFIFNAFKRENPLSSYDDYIVKQMEYI